MIEIFEIEQNELDPDGAPKYNIAPTDTVPVVLERLVPPEVLDSRPGLDSGSGSGSDGGSEAGSEAGSDEGAGPDLDAAGAVPDPEQERAVRQLRALTWGLVPSWSKDRSGAARMINARAETLLDRSAYAKAALSRRCLVPADGWYEWQVSPTAVDAKGKPRKQPFFIQLASGSALAFAGIYEFWRERTVHADDPHAWLVTFAVITTAAEAGLEAIHDRMPLVLPEDRWDDWLAPTRRDPDGVRALLAPPPPGRFAAVPVSTRVNSVRNEGPDLLVPAAPQDLLGVLDPATGLLIGERAPAEEPLF